MYKAEGDEQSDKTILPALQRTACQCFANTTIVYGHLADEVSQFKFQRLHVRILCQYMRHAAHIKDPEKYMFARLTRV